MAATVSVMGEPTTTSIPRTVVVTIALVLLAVGFAINRVANRDVPDGLDARAACETFVQERLNERPVLPERGHGTATLLFYNMQHVGAAPAWTVTGSVQVGGSLRYHFTCQVRLDGGVFRLVELTGLSD
jgi:hypothetical protein